MERRLRCASICFRCHTDIIAGCHFDRIKVRPAFRLLKACFQCNRLFYFVIHEERQCYRPACVSALPQVRLIILHFKGNRSGLRRAERHCCIDIRTRRRGEKPVGLIRDHSIMARSVNARSVIRADLPVRVCRIITCHISPCAVSACLHLSEPHIPLLRSCVIHCPAVFILLEDPVFLYRSILSADAKDHVFCDLIRIVSPFNARLIRCDRHSGLCLRIDRYIPKQFRHSCRILLRKRYIDHRGFFVCHVHSRSKLDRRHIALSRSDLRCCRDLMAEEVVLDLKAILVGDHFSRIDRRRIFRQLVPVKYCRLFRVFMQPCLSVVSCCRRT